MSETLLTTLKLLNALQQPMPLETSESLFKDVRAEEYKDEKQYQIKKELQMELVKQITYAHMKSGSIVKNERMPND